MIPEKTKSNAYSIKQKTIDALVRENRQLKTTAEILTLSHSVLDQKAPQKAYFAIENLTEYPVRQICEVLQIPRATYYYCKNHQRRVPYTKRELALLKSAFLRHYGNFGRRGMKRILQNEDNVCFSEQKIARMMKILNLHAKYGRKSVCNPQNAAKIDIFATQTCRIDAADLQNEMQIWSIDFTKEKIADGDIYVCGVISVFDKVVVACNLGDAKSCQLAVSTLQSAIHRFGKPDVVQTDRGVQFTGSTFCRLLARNGIVHSVSRPYTPVDNRWIETFWKTMKIEIGPTEHLTRWQYQMLLENFVRYYNDRRPHSNLGYLSPTQYYRAAKA